MENFFVDFMSFALSLLNKVGQNNSQYNHGNLGYIEFMSFATFENNGRGDMK